MVFNKRIKSISIGVGVGFTTNITYSLRDQAVIQIANYIIADYH